MTLAKFPIASPARHLLAAAAVFLLGASQAHAAPLKDAQWMALLDAGKTVELDKLARARVQAQPDDTQGYLAIALAAVATGEGSRLDAALKQAETCVERQPQSAVCHYALGSVMGVQAMSASMFKVMGMAGKIREAFAKAVDLDPLFFEARDSLVQFYLMAPSLAGGSVSKAKEAAAAIQAKQPEPAKLLRARIALKEEKWSEVERELASLQTDDKGLRDEAVGVLGQLGAQFVNDKQAAKAKLVFERLQKDYPQYAVGPYGLGRVQAEAGQPELAIPLFEQARGLEGAANYPVDYRLGMAFQAKGDKVQAKAALERFIARGKANPRYLDDAKKRLSELA